MKSEIEWRILLKSIDNTLTTEEKEKLEEWLSADKNHRTYYRKFCVNYNVISTTNIKDSTYLTGNNKCCFFRYNKSNYILKIVAMCLMFLGIPIVYYNIDYYMLQKSNHSSISNQVTYSLADGNEIEINNHV